jgi:hypothetical protein
VAALGALYLLLPYEMTAWYHVNTRVVPYLWMALLLRIPESVPRWMTGLLCVSALSYSIGNGVDYRRLDAETTEYLSAMDRVPERARLLPMVVRAKSTSENTQNILHLWGYYVVEKHVTAPLLFAHSRSFALTYREAPPINENHLVLEGFAPRLAPAETLCNSIRQDYVIFPDDCMAFYQEHLGQFFGHTTPAFDYMLLWDATPDALSAVPAAYQTMYRNGRLVLLGKKNEG